MGIRVLNYLDDWLILAQSKAMAASHRDAVRAHMSLESSLGRPPHPESLGGPSTLMAHKLPRDEGRVSSIKTLSQTAQVGAADSALCRDKVSFAESDFHPRAHKSGCRLPVEAGAEARGVASPSTGGGEHLADFRPCGSGSVHLWACMLWYRRGRGYACTVAHQSASRLSPPSSSGSSLACSSLVCGPYLPSRWHSLGDSCQERSPLSGAGGYLHPRHEMWKF
ncbi:hypothetical protein QTP86_027732 [Hemibagrus guttatus]|nr:hypothetical protein QTP86_027732 [Hemibagrus guttatus]